MTENSGETSEGPKEEVAKESSSGLIPLGLRAAQLPSRLAGFRSGPGHRERWQVVLGYELLIAMG